MIHANPAYQVMITPAQSDTNPIHSRIACSRIPSVGQLVRGGYQTRKASINPLSGRRVALVCPSPRPPPPAPPPQPATRRPRLEASHGIIVHMRGGYAPVRQGEELL